MKKPFYLFLLTGLLIFGPETIPINADFFKKIGKELNLKKVLEKGVKVVAIGALIKHLSGPLNDFINTFTLNHGAENRAQTKVVPILTLGQGTVIGAAQVAGSPELLDQVKSVIALETRFASDNRFHIKAYVPNRHSTPVPLDRIQGVGVSAIIDYKL